ncbi:glycosyltransferase [Pedobacter sandarakinus]|uniref:glycosyltransferase n=1 Tax=Pedobacter sandarakinus TaxID=353156 RepID=UPI0022474D8E|nr:glycosyltransferase [Pedobacter sandarakinus]MCX2573427.1 glycosyltransferase [Pedobacter sandarakinus]
MDKPLVSIALCTYNGEKYLVEQLDSIINQTYPNLEIIVVDDHSSDLTPSILRSYENQLANFKVYENEKNLGYIKNFERAVSLCTGDFIALCDQDDVWDLNKINILVTVIGYNDLIYHDSAFISSDGTPLHKNLSDIINMYEGDSVRPFLLSNSVSGHACLFKKDLVNYIVPFPSEIFHDRWISFVATNHGSIKYLNQPLAKYRQHEKSDTNILKLKREKPETILYGRVKIQKTLNELQIFASYQYNKDQKFIEILLKHYRSRLNSYLCFGLIFFMYAHYKSLLFISKKSTISKLNFIFKHIWGSKFKAD